VTAPALAGPGEEVWSVSRLVADVKGLVEGSYGALWVQGEVSEFKAYASGHWYFTLKDEGAQVRCVMWKGNASRAGRPPENGTQVFARAEPGIYPERGEFRLVVSRLLATAEAGAGQREFERVKAALARDGLFDERRKRPLPAMPLVVAVVTSPDGAALRDIQTVARARWPLVTLLVVPTRVQGDAAVAEVARALAAVNRLPGVDLCILARGGGSKEDLAVFNTEPVCRALAAVRVPTISAVGHETDISLTDLVADRRAATPSAAVELALPDQHDVLARLGQLSARLAGGLTRRTRVAAERLERSGDRMQAGIERRLDRSRRLVAHLAAQLDALSPLRVLERGYAVARGADGRVLRRVAEFPPGTPFRLRVADGDVAARAEGRA